MTVMVIARNSDWVAPEEFADEPTVEICSDFNDLVSRKAADPTIIVVKAQSVAGGSVRAELDDCPIIINQDILHRQLGAIWKNFA